MSGSKTRLMHTRPTERPFYCITGDFSGEGFLVIVDARTHDLVVEQGDDGTVTVRVNPKGVEVKGPTVRPGTRMLEIPPPAADPEAEAGDIPASPPEHGWITLPGTRAVEFPPSAERLRRGAIGAPRARNQKVLSGD